MEQALRVGALCWMWAIIISISSCGSSLACEPPRLGVLLILASPRGQTTFCGSSISLQPCSQMEYHQRNQCGTHLGGSESAS